MLILPAGKRNVEVSPMVTWLAPMTVRVELSGRRIVMEVGSLETMLTCPDSRIYSGSDPVNTDLLTAV